MTAPEVIVVGGGVWGLTLARKIREMDGAHLHSVVDPEVLPTDSSMPFAPSLPGVVPEHGIIATPPDSHVAAARDLVERGARSIRIEKPVGMGVGDIEELRELEEVYGVRFTTGYQMLHSRAWRLVKAWAEADAGGLVRADYYRLSRSEPRHVTSALLDLGSHAAAYHADLAVDARIGCRATIIAQHDALSNRRTMRLERMDGSVCAVGGDKWTDIDGVSLGPVRDQDDPLAASLDAWLSGTDTRGLDFAARVHEILDEQRTEVFA